ncbi:hemolysin family protein [Embleya sp. MST-111070]|uniref:hemolysin family protein n=1 Tax=Embleya sp. MST-111070 TaxID=3398231 RepID=UPI003F73BE05
MTAALGIAAIVVLTLGTGFFVAQEFAYVAADRSLLRRRAEAGDKAAARAMTVMGRLSFMLSGAQLGITVTALLVGFIAEPALAAVISPLLELVSVPDGAVPVIALVLGFAVATAIQMVLGELVPKNWGIAEPERVAVLLGRPTIVYLKVAGPLIRLFDTLANRIVRSIGIEPVEELHGGATTEELAHIVDEAGRDGDLDPGLSGILRRAIAFGDLTVDQVMVPRPDVVRVRAETTAAELIELVAERGHSHYPVVGERVDDVLGVVGVACLLEVAPEDAAHVTAGSIARPALLVPDTAGLASLLEQLRAANEEFAVVLDEHGGLAGIVTYEDVAEELVGEIADESDNEDPVDTEPEDGWWRLDAGLRVDETERIVGAELPDGPYDTLGGLVIAHLGRLPEVGDRIRVPDPDEVRAGRSAEEDDEPIRYTEIEVLAVERHVPALVRLRVLTSEPAFPRDIPEWSADRRSGDPTRATEVTA